MKSQKNGIKQYFIMKNLVMLKKKYHVCFMKQMKCNNQKDMFYKRKIQYYINGGLIIKNHKKIMMKH